jgi:hypothetical protein
MKYEEQKRQLLEDTLVFIFDQRTGELEVVESESSDQTNNLPEANGEYGKERDVI